MEKEKVICLMSKKEEKKNRNNTDLIEAINTIEDFKKKDNENIKYLNWLEKELIKREKVSTEDVIISPEQRNFLFWFFNYVNIYCNTNYIDLELFEKDDYFLNQIYININNNNIVLEVGYKPENIEVTIFKLTEEKEHILDLEDILKNKPYKDKNNLRNKIVLNELNNIMDLYEVNKEELIDILLNDRKAL